MYFAMPLASAVPELSPRVQPPWLQLKLAALRFAVVVVIVAVIVVIIEIRVLRISRLHVQLDICRHARSTGHWQSSHFKALRTSKPSHTIVVLHAIRRVVNDHDTFWSSPFPLLRLCCQRLLRLLRRLLLLLGRLRGSAGCH